MMSREIYIFMGPPGAGKGTLSARCIESFGWQQLSTGTLCREHIAAQTHIGKEIDFIIKSGKLISDSLIIAMVKEWLASQKDNNPLIIDGFPRTVSQAQALHDLLKQEQFSGSKLRLVSIQVPDDIVLNRLTSRMLCSNGSCEAIYSLNSVQSELKELRCTKCSSVLRRRSDDHENTIRERLTVYHQHAQGLLGFFKNNGYVVVDIPGELPMDDVFNHFREIIDLAAV